MILAVKVRRAVSSDIPEFIKNKNSVSAEGRYLFNEDEVGILPTTTLFYDENCLVLVAEVGAGKKRKIVGSLELEWYGGGKKTRHTRMLSMHIMKSYRGMGIGTQLMANALAWATSRNDIKKICLGVFSSNKRAIRLYEKFGFELDGIKKRQYIIDGKYADEINMAFWPKRPS